MKKIRCGVHCQYWKEPVYFEIEVPDDATDEDIQKELSTVALELSELDYWIEETHED